MKKELRTLLTMLLLVLGTSMSWAIDDFEVDLMQENPALPAGVEATNDGAHAPYFNGGHGWANYVFKFTTTESVKITMQNCYYGDNSGILACVKDGVNGNVLGYLETKSTSCEGEVSWTYISDGTPKTLYVHCGAYCHHVKVEFLKVTDGVKDVQSNTPGLDTYYNLSGHKNSALNKGINIIRSTNGETKKVLLR